MSRCKESLEDFDEENLNFEVATIYGGDGIQGSRNKLLVRISDAVTIGESSRE